MKIMPSLISSNLFLFVLICILSQPVSAEGLYKWVDKYGNITYQSDPPPANATNIEKSKITVSDEAESAQDAGDDLKIEFYSKIECPNCDKARSYLEEKGLTFEEIVIEEDTVGADEMREEFGHINVPTIKIGETSLSGYSEKTLERVLKNSGIDVTTEEKIEEL